MRLEMFEKIKVGVIKQLNVGLLSVTSYPPWVANVVLVPTKNGKVRMCVDYRDLDRVSPKNDFRCHILTFWLTTPLNIKYFLSWMVSHVIIRSRWHLKTWRKLPSSRSEELSATRLCLLG